MYRNNIINMYLSSEQSIATSLLNVKFCGIKKYDYETNILPENTQEYDNNFQGTWSSLSAARQAYYCPVKNK